MKPEEFVDVLRAYALDRAVEGTLELLEKPPGRRPRSELMMASAWVRSLGAEHRTLLRRVIELTAHEAVFGVLAVLDGSRPFEGAGEKGSFELTFRRGVAEWPLTGESVAPLHEMLDLQWDTQEGSRELKE